MGGRTGARRWSPGDRRPTELEPDSQVGAAGFRLPPRRESIVPSSMPYKDRMDAPFGDSRGHRSMAPKSPGGCADGDPGWHTGDRVFEGVSRHADCWSSRLLAGGQMGGRSRAGTFDRDQAMERLQGVNPHSPPMMIGSSEPSAWTPNTLRSDEPTTKSTWMLLSLIPASSRSCSDISTAPS